MSVLGALRGDLEVAQLQWMLERCRGLLHAMPYVQHVIDMGAGKGDLSLLLAHHFPSLHVTAVDVNHRSLQQGEASAAELCMTNIAFLHMKK